MNKEQEDKHNRNQLRVYLLKYEKQLQEQYNSSTQPSVRYQIDQLLDAVDKLLDNLPIS